MPLPACVRFAVLVEDLCQPGRLDPLVNVVVDHDHRRQAAGAETAAHVQRKQPVGSRLAHFDPQQFLQFGQHLLAAADVAGGAQAHAHQMLAARHGGEERIEPHHARHFAVRLVQRHGDFLQRLLGQVAEHGLGDLQHGNQRPGHVGILFQHVVQLRQQFLLGGLLAAGTLAAFRGYLHVSLPKLSTRDADIKPVYSNTRGPGDSRACAATPLSRTAGYYIMVGCSPILSWPMPGPLDDMTATQANAATVGLLLSGGLDSGILLGHLLSSSQRVRPFYIRSQVVWEEAELRAVRAILQTMAPGLAEPLIVFDMPLRDLYGDHWSVTGRHAPGADTPDDAVYLPGRNALLAIKPALWCALHGIEELALAILASNPFADATDEFFHDFETTINRAVGSRVKLLRPFAGLQKKDVMLLGRGMPLELTFSCIAPVDGAHCGRCNKCAERQEAFRSVDAVDPTEYAEERNDEGIARTLIPNP